MAIRELLTAKTASERSAIKSVEIPKLVTTGEYVHTAHGITAELQGAVAIPGGISVLARAKTTADGKPIGFGDGSVEWERFRIYNPPIMVPDGTTHTENGLGGTTYQKNNFKEDPVAALREVIAHNVKLTGKPGAAITPGKVGRTVSTFYPDASVETTSVDGYTPKTAQATWALAHDGTAGDGVDDAGPNGYARSSAVFDVYRFCCLFDTSAIADADTISAATLSLYATAKTNGDDDGEDFIAIITSSPASNTALVNEDFDQYGTTEQHDVGERKDITNVTTGAYVDFVLNATGRGNISKTAITKFGAREGHDLLNSAPVGTNEVNFASADTAGTTQDPKLVVTHATPTAPRMFLVL